MSDDLEKKLQRSHRRSGPLIGCSLLFVVLGVAGGVGYWLSQPTGQDVLTENRAALIEVHRRRCEVLAHVDSGAVGLDPDEMRDARLRDAYRLVEKEDLERACARSAVGRDGVYRYIASQDYEDARSSASGHLARRWLIVFSPRERTQSRVLSSTEWEPGRLRGEVRLCRIEDASCSAPLPVSSDGPGFPNGQVFGSSDERRMQSELDMMTRNVFHGAILQPLREAGVRLPRSR